MSELSRLEKNKLGVAEGFGACPNCDDCWSWKEAGRSIMYEWKENFSRGILICTECLENPDILSIDKIRRTLSGKIGWDSVKAELAIKAIKAYKDEQRKEVEMNDKNKHVELVTDVTFEEVILKFNKPVLVDFWAPWCGPCVAFAPIFEKEAERFGNKVKFCKLNVDENSKTAEQFSVQSIPTVILFENGKEKLRALGGKEAKELIASLGVL